MLMLQVWWIVMKITEPVYSIPSIFVAGASHDIFLSSRCRVLAKKVLFVSYDGYVLHLVQQVSS